jgi:phage terminase large subunit-like protein
MADWSGNNRACETTWTTLYIMHQLITNFDESGDLQIKDLTFFNPLNSSPLRMQEAGVIADHIDKVFIQARGAVYEEGITQNDAINALVNILIDGEKTVSDLAKVADENYLFWQE